MARKILVCMDHGLLHDRYPISRWRTKMERILKKSLEGDEEQEHAAQRNHHQTPTASPSITIISRSSLRTYKKSVRRFCYCATLVTTFSASRRCPETRFQHATLSHSRWRVSQLLLNWPKGWSEGSKLGWKLCAFEGLSGERRWEASFGSLHGAPCARSDLPRRNGDRAIITYKGIGLSKRFLI